MTTPPGSVRRRVASKSKSKSTSAITTTPRRGSAPLRAVLLALSLLAFASLVAHAAAEEDETLAISTFRLDLTMERTAQPDDGDGESSSWESVDSTIQSAAEKHLASVYALELDSTPTQVLLTVVSASPDGDDEDDASKAGAQGDSGIFVRRSFLGGVVGLPSDGPPPPTRSELDGVTLKAFEIPGYGEYFLKALRDSGDPGLEGLLLIGAGAVDGGMDYVEDDGPQSAASSDATAASSSSSPAAGSGQVVIMGQAMNVWAIAAVAALGAMFLVIVLCTSILYCDWRGRRRRRERKRAERTASAGNARGAPRPSLDRRFTDVEMAAMDDDGGKRGAKHDLHVVIPTMSDETEGIELSPATTNSSSRGRPSFANRATSSGGVMGGGGGNGQGGGHQEVPRLQRVVV